MPCPGLHRPGRGLPGGAGGPAGSAGGDSVRPGRLPGGGAAERPRGGGLPGRPHQPRDGRCDGAPHMVPATRPVRGRLPAGSVSCFPKWTITYLDQVRFPSRCFISWGFWYLPDLCICAPDFLFVLSSGTVTFIRIRDISPGSGTLIYMVTLNNIFRIHTDIESFQERYDNFQELYRRLLIYFRSRNWWRA